MTSRNTAMSAYSWRAAELVSKRERRLLARSLQTTISQAHETRPYLTSASVANHAAARLCTPELQALARRLADLERPVSPAGVLLVHQLLERPDSPLYDPKCTPELPHAVATILTRLDPDEPRGE
jgi:hypothetical protein